MIKNITVPFKEELNNLEIGDQVLISGIIYAARDVVMSKLKGIIENDKLSEFPVPLDGYAIMHTAFSVAGYGPTSSNKEEIESMMGTLSEHGIKYHLGKGAIKQNTIDEISQHGSIFIVVPPTTALLQDRLLAKKVVAFEEEGMEAMFELHVKEIPGIVAAANYKSIFDK